MGNAQQGVDQGDGPSTGTSPPPWFTHGLESPPYVSIETKEGYEIRQYKPSKWVGIQQEANSCKTASSDSFWPLFKFISGENDAKKKITMTCPVAVKVPTAAAADSKRLFTTQFYLPFQYQGVSNEDLPKPNHPEVTYHDYPEITAYVISYSGFTSDSKLSQHTAQLATMLERDGVTYDKTMAFYAGYDPPYRLFNRHNEVWFVATQQAEAAATP